VVQKLEKSLLFSQLLLTQPFFTVERAPGFKVYSDSVYIFSCLVIKCSLTKLNIQDGLYILDPWDHWALPEILTSE
jgi:hypothetical protein